MTHNLTWLAMLKEGLAECRRGEELTFTIKSAARMSALFFRYLAWL
ncbi:MAG: hypothetical protein H7126_10405 [Candidatus Parcubacteria bacterium]|nr:hypothetical protein [Leptolyngbyaceae cyanobacterium LF-bin-113]